jgi:hypothetical protein
MADPSDKPLLCVSLSAAPFLITQSACQLACTLEFNISLGDKLLYPKIKKILNGSYVKIKHKSYYCGYNSIFPHNIRLMMMYLNTFCIYILIFISWPQKNT